MSILSAIKQQNNSIDDLAALPQAMIMQMAQKKQISEEMLAPILSRKAEMADAFARQNSLQNAGQIPPTVMEQLMAQNAQAEQPQMPQQMQQPMPQQMPQETGVAQLPIPERQYAGGGIVAFDEGGDVEEDLAYEMAREDADMNMGSSIGDIYKMARQGIGRLRGMLPESYESTKAKVKSYVMPESKSGGHPLESKAVEMANKVGLDPRLMLHALNKETGGLKDPATAQSKAGAYGPMQLMAGTAKELGVDRTDVDQNLYGGAIYLKKMMDKYKDPQLALAAYNGGPGRLDKALRSQSGLAALPRETQNYMRYAQGGEVRNFYEGDYVDPMGSAPVITNPEMGSYQSIVPGSTENLLANKRITQKEYENIQKRKETSKPAPKETPKIEPSGKDLQSIFANHTAQQQANPERDVFAEMIAENAQRRADIKESAKEDKNLALLSAGLGMLGGTSPYAMVNIGQGGAKGVESLAASKTRRAAEQNALSNADLKALYYGQENKRKQLALSEGMRDKDLDNLNARDLKLQAMFFIPGIPQTPKMVESYENAKKNDPIYQQLLKNAGVNSAAPSAPVLNYSLKSRSLS